jgi:hypothetical protein
MSITEAEKKQVQSIRRKFNWLVFKARAAEFIERAAPAIIPPALVTAGFLAVSWTGLWGAAPTVARIAGSLLFASAAAASPFIFAKKSLLVTEKDAMARIDSHIGDEKETPAKTIGGGLHDDSDHVQEELWRLNITTTWNRFSSQFRAGFPSIPKFKLLAPFTAAVFGLAAASGTYLSNDRVGDVQQAFNWNFPDNPHEEVAQSPLEFKGWIAPPTTIEVEPVYFDHSQTDHRNGGKKLHFHEQSKLTILVMNQEANITVNGRKMDLEKTMKSGTRRDPKTTYVYEMELGEEDIEISVENGPSIYYHVTKDGAPLAEINGIEFGSEDGDQSLNIEYTIDDDIGVRDGKIRINLSGKKDDDTKKPLPSTTILPVPVR